MIVATGVKPMATMPPSSAPMQPSPRKGVSPIVWVLLVIAGLIVLAGIAVIGGGIWIARKVSDNPVAAAATILAAANPDIEVLSRNDEGGTVTFREKSTGKTVTLNLDQMKRGKVIFSGDGKDVVMQAGEDGLHVKSSDGSTVDIGRSNAKLPDWIPTYPGTTVQGSFSTSGRDESAASVGFTTKDGNEKVLKFYEDGLKNSGLHVSRTSGGVITARSEDGTRQVTVHVSGDEGESTVGITYSTKRAPADR
jgi:hypothetical protein